MPHPVAEPIPTLVIAGPTAGGKSRLALAMARQFGGTIINADSMQVYADLAVITSRPDAGALAQAPHRLYGVLDAADLCSAPRWAALARAEIERVHGEGGLPILVGGTGLYLRTLLEGIAEIPDIPAEVRGPARALHAEIGGAAFHALLAERDPESAARLHVADSQRLIRAYEVVTATGHPLGWWQLQAAAPPEWIAPLRFVVMPPREALYAACDRRFDSMLQEGAIEEVARLRARNLAADLPVMKALGVPELLRFLAGEIGLREAATLAKQATRHYAKRQMTWFRHRMNGAHIMNTQLSNNLDEETLHIVRNWLDRCVRPA